MVGRLGGERGYEGCVLSSLTCDRFDILLDLKAYEHKRWALDIVPYSVVE